MGSEGSTSVWDSISSTHTGPIAPKRSIPGEWSSPCSPRHKRHGMLGPMKMFYFKI